MIFFVLRRQAVVGTFRFYRIVVCDFSICSNECLSVFYLNSSRESKDDGVMGIIDWNAKTPEAGFDVQAPARISHF